MMTRLRSFCVFVAFAGFVAVCVLPPAAAAQPGVHVIDHYLFYVTLDQFTAAPGNVNLSDQFGNVGPVTSFQLRAFGNPVDKNGEGILDPTAHLSLYDFDNVPTPLIDVDVTDQFGSGPWQVRDATLLLLPAAKDDPAGMIPVKDHYLCYDVIDGPAPNVQVNLVDQFGSYTVVVGQAVLLCNPAEKVVDGVVYPIIEPDEHLALYLVDEVFINRSFSFLDQFLGQQTVAVNTWFLAVPADKQFPTVGVEESTWGGIKALYKSEQ